MDKPTIQQHHVWRYYLEKWTTQGKVACLQNKDTLFVVSTVKIAKEKLFYQFCESSDTEFQIAYSMSDDCSRKILQMYESINTLLRQARLNNDKEMYNKLLTFCKDFEEKNYNCMVENAFKPSLDMLYRMDFSFLDKEDTKLPFCNAIAEQYCRTRLMKHGVLLSVEQSKINGVNYHNAWFLIRHCLACKIGMALAFKEYRFGLLVSNDSSFITGDQPIINVHANYQAPKGLADDFELFYPLSPSLSLFITNNVTFKNKEVQTIGAERVNELNTMIANASQSQIYAKSESDLLKFKL